MRLTIVLLIATLMQVSAAGLAQRITLKERNVPLENVLKEIRRQSGYDIFFNGKLLDNTQNISISVSNVKLEEALNASLNGLPLAYKLEGKTATIIAKEEPSFLDKTLLAIQNTLVIQSVAKDLDVKGRVLDQDGKPLPNASIRVKGKNAVTNTNAEGEFEMKGVADDAVLLVSYVGFKTLEIGLKGATMPLEIKLNVAAGELDEVKVTYNTGYQTIPKERSTGSFEFVDNKLLNRRVSSNIIDRLQGLVTGMAFNRTGLFSTNEISIRGRSTIFSNANPLIVVDNYPYEGDINNVNPNDIESITILKDAAAASVWGTRAGNGVVVITTKSGKLNQKTKIDFNSNVTVGEKPDLFYLPKLASSDVIDIETLLFNKGQYNTDINNTTTFPALSPVTEILLKARNGQISQDEAKTQIDALRLIDNRNDYAKYSYKNRIAQRHGINISGGSPKTEYYFSSGYDKDISSFKDVSSRVTANLKTTIYITPKLSMNTAAFFVRNLDKLGSLPQMGASRYIYERPVDDYGNGINVTQNFRKSFEDQAFNRGFLNWRYNPFENAKLNNSQTKRNDLRLNIGGKYQLFPFLSFNVNYQFQQQNISGILLNSSDSFFTRDIVNRYSQIDAVTKNVISRPVPTGGILNNESNQITANNGRIQLNFDKDFGEHKIRAISGFELTETKSSSSWFRLYGYDEETTLSKSINYDVSYVNYPSMLSQVIVGAPSLGPGTLDRFRSIYFNAAYSYRDRYHLNVSTRKDASNYFGVKANQRGVPLWSSGIKYDLDKESFYKLSWLPILKLRATFGYTGNINKSVSALSTIRYDGFSSPYNLQLASIQNPPNPNLKWEKTSQLNLGVDFGSKNNIVSGSIEFYYKNGKDLIGDGPLDGTTGIITIAGDARFRGNIANMRGKGVDVSINTINISGKLKWTSNFLFSYNKDEVTKYNLKILLGDALNYLAVSPIEGQPVFSLHSYKWGGLDPATGDPLGYVNNQISKNYGLLLNPRVEDLVYSGPTRPPYFGAFRNLFSYNGFSVSANIIYKLGYVFRNKSIDYGLLFASPTTNGHSDYYNRWMKPGNETVTNVPSLVYPNVANRNAFYTQSEAAVERGDHVRLQDISFGYSFNNSKFISKFFKAFAINGYVNDIGVLWKRSKRIADPDFVTDIPSPRTYSIGFNAQF